VNPDEPDPPPAKTTVTPELLWMELEPPEVDQPVEIPPPPTETVSVIPLLTANAAVQDRAPPPPAPSQPPPPPPTQMAEMELTPT